VPKFVWELNEPGEQARVFELAQGGAVLFGQAGRERSKLVPKCLERGDCLSGRLHPIPRNVNQRDGNAVGVGRQPASVLLPQVTEQSAESFGFDKVR
jgi:hypothetical protein